MTWFYAINGEQLGPVPEEELQALAAAGRITPNTLVWKDGMASWEAFSKQFPSSGPALSVSLDGKTSCPICNKFFLPGELVNVAGTPVCATCKPIALQRLREGSLSSARSFRYGGFWVRFIAYVIDSLILSLLSFPVMIGASMLGIMSVDPNAETPEVSGIFLAGFGLIYLLFVFATFFYHGWFLSRKGATPGKMAMGLQVVNPDGSFLTLGRGMLRILAQIVSAIILYIGFIMVAFDNEKRSLHDRLMNTRVVYKDGRN
jgi:uncharacterized RDD family membrane protein YckC